MATYLIQRLTSGGVTLLLIALITFGLMHAVPGGPFDLQAGVQGASPQLVRSAEAYYGLDEPWPRQFLGMLAHLLRGDLGVSFAQQGRPVAELMADRIVPSVMLGGMAFAFAVVVGIPLGVVAAVRRNSAWDHASLLLSTVLGAVPHFVLAFVLLLLFAVGLGWVDVRVGRGFGDGISSLPAGVIPALALGAPSMALLVRLTRAAMLEVLAADYVRTAYAKGLSPWAVYLRHGLRNALLPVLTVLSPILAALITGSIVIETIFGVPGIGSAFVTSVAQRDYGMIMGTTLFYAAVIVALNLVVDLLYPIADPRVRVR